MKKLLLTLSLLLSTTTFSSQSFGEWDLGEIIIDPYVEFYWDRRKVRSSNGLVYWYFLQNYMKPTEPYGYLSLTIYYESDCQRMSIEELSYAFYKQAMAEGQAEDTYTSPNPKVSYPTLSSSIGIVLKEVCDYVNFN